MSPMGALERSVNDDSRWSPATYSSRRLHRRVSKYRRVRRLEYLTLHRRLDRCGPLLDSGSSRDFPVAVRRAQTTAMPSGSGYEVFGTRSRSTFVVSLLTGITTLLVVGVHGLIQQQEQGKVKHIKLVRDVNIHVVLRASNELIPWRI